MHHLTEPRPVEGKFLTPTVIALIIIVLNGLVWLVIRFLFGIGAVANLTDQYPWGILKGVNVAAGVALAAGGFTTAALTHIFHKEYFHDIIRPALLLAFLGYMFAGMSVVIDLGRFYQFWHPLVFWNGNSVLFEVAICVMAYVTVLGIEFMPIVCERFIGRVNLKGVLSIFNRPIDLLLRYSDRILDKTLFFFIITGVVLSCLHQSSLGALMMLAGQKVHPLWQSPISPLMFLLSAIAVGFPMVIMQTIITEKSLDLKPSTNILANLGKYVGPLLGIYLASKIGDLVIRETFVYLTSFSVASVMWTIEILFGVIIPLRMFFWDKVLTSRPLLLTASLLLIMGVFLNRFNVFITAYKPLYTETPYWPALGEISISLGLVALQILLFRAFIFIFPVMSQPIKHLRTKTKYAIRGVIR